MSPRTQMIKRMYLLEQLVIEDAELIKALGGRGEDANWTMGESSARRSELEFLRGMIEEMG